MQACFYLFIFLHIAEGCILNNVEVSRTASSGGSVVLLCTCNDPQNRETSFIWAHRKKGDTLNDIYPTNETNRYSARVKLVNADTPENFNISISGLTVEDEGDYQCRDKNRPHNFMTVHLSVTAGTTRPHGGSKTTPSSQEPHGASTTTASSAPKPEATSSPNAGSTITSSAPQPKGGIITTVSTTPKAEISPVNLPFVPFALVTVVVLHIIVAVVYCSTRKKDFSGAH